MPPWTAQNCNETLNTIIWTKRPKNIFVEKETLEIGVNSAIHQFNIRPKRVYKVLNHFNMEPGIITQYSSSKQLVKRIKNSEKRQSDVVTKRRKHHRGTRKGFTDMEKNLRGESLMFLVNFPKKTLLLTLNWMFSKSNFCMYFKL